MWDIHKGYQGRASKILYVHSISATWNRVDRTRGPRLSQTIPCAVRVVPSYARTAVVRIDVIDDQRERSHMVWKGKKKTA